MFLFHTKENTPHKYVDLIKEAAAKWPNWDPPKTIHAGDFGTINRKTGELVVEGNIYTHVDIRQIASQYPPLQVAEVDHFRIHSCQVKELDVKADGM